jgi:hypothetical protein
MSNYKLSIGDKIRLIKTNDQYTKLQSGAQGIVSFIDDLGTIHVNWNDGSTLGLIPEIDSYERI